MGAEKALSKDKMYTKRGSFGDTFLYDGDGNVIGRGFTDSHGTTRFTGTNGEYIGRSDPGVLGGEKLFDSAGEYIGDRAEDIGLREGDVETYSSRGNTLGSNAAQNPYSSTGSHSNSSPQYHYSSSSSGNGFDEVLAICAAAGFICLSLGLMLGWEGLWLYLVVFIVSIFLLLVRNK